MAINKLKKILIIAAVAIVFVCLLCLSLSAQSYSGTCGAEGDGSNLTWTLDSDGLLKIEGTGSMADYSWSDAAPWRSYRSGIKTVEIAEGVTSIGDSTFDACHSLASITIPESVTNIRESTFQACDSLASITIPESVTNIGAYAFNSCYGMAEYHLKPTTPPTLYNTSAFTNIPSDCVIYVPQGCLEAYQNDAKWAKYASKMQEEPA